MAPLSYAVIGAKKSGKVVPNYDKPHVKPAKGEVMSMTRPIRMVPYDRQEEEYGKFLSEGLGDIFARDAKTLCESSNQDFLFLFRAADNMMRTAVSNFKGPLGTGVCWWISDFQFHFLFLTYVDPTSPKPDFETKKILVQKILEGKEVVKLAGYKSISEFMQDPDIQSIVKSQISNQYLIDSFLKMKWANRKPAGDAQDMETQFKSIKTFLENNKLPTPVFVDLKGPAAHTLIALKTIKMETFNPKFPVPESWLFSVLDSNAVSTALSYNVEEKKFIANMNMYAKPKDFVDGKPVLELHEPKVYLDNPQRYRIIKNALDNFCKEQGFKKFSRLTLPQGI